MLSIREELIILVRKNPLLSAAEIARSLKTTRADIQYHLGILFKQGILLRRKMPLNGRGRPVYLYQISQNIQPDNFPRLISCLLSLISSNYQLDSSEVIARELFPSTSLSEKKTQTVYQFINMMNQMGYEARWEAHSNGPKIILRNCPYRMLAQKEPLLCMIDQAGIEQNLGQEYFQTTKLFQAGGKDVACVFMTKKP